MNVDTACFSAVDTLDLITASFGLIGVIIGGLITFLIENRMQKKERFANACAEMISAYMRWANNRTVENAMIFYGASQKVKLFGDEKICNAVENLESAIALDVKDNEENSDACRELLRNFTLLAKNQLR